MNIKCSNCNKDSGIESTESKGRDAAIVQIQIQWIPKCDALFEKGTGEWYFYCSKECKEIHYKKVIENISSNEDQKKVKKIISNSKKKFKKDLPKIKNDLQTIVNIFKNKI
jgi:hypothetical protein